MDISYKIILVVLINQFTLMLLTRVKFLHFFYNYIDSPKLGCCCFGRVLKLETHFELSRHKVLILEDGSKG